MRHNYTIGVRISVLGKRLCVCVGGGVYSFTLVPVGIRTTYRTDRSLIHVYVLYSFIYFFFWRDMRQYICGTEKATTIGKHWNSYYYY